MTASLEGRVVAVTGAARGIGFAIAKALHAQGARVALSDIDEATLKEAATALGTACYARLDVTDPQAFGAFLAKVEAELGPLDALVNNAGIMPSGPLLDEDDRITRRVLEIDTLGVIYGTKRALELMVPRGCGHIVNMASTMGEAAVPGLASYNAAKAAVLMFSDAARLEFRTSGVQISAILPGGVNTELTAGVDASIAVKVPGTPVSVPLVKHVEPEDIADAVVRTLAEGKSRPRVYVPRSFGLLLQSRRFLPQAVAEGLNRALGAETKVLRDTDQERRRAYQERIRKT